jgi:tagaturonate epimerase
MQKHFFKKRFIESLFTLKQHKQCFEKHLFPVNELKKLNVKFASIALRFIGGFEKGVDYKGDISLFKKEYCVHHAITRYFGNYKLSFHSVSDKFLVYNAVAEISEMKIFITIF